MHAKVACTVAEGFQGRVNMHTQVGVGVQGRQQMVCGVTLEGNAGRTVTGVPPASRHGQALLRSFILERWREKEREKRRDGERDRHNKRVCECVWLCGDAEAC